MDHGPRFISVRANSAAVLTPTFSSSSLLLSDFYLSFNICDITAEIQSGSHNSKRNGETHHCPLNTSSTSVSICRRASTTFPPFSLSTADTSWSWLSGEAGLEFSGTSADWLCGKAGVKGLWLAAVTSVPFPPSSSFIHQRICYFSV